MFPYCNNTVHHQYAEEKTTKTVKNPSLPLAHHIGSNYTSNNKNTNRKIEKLRLAHATPLFTKNLPTNHGVDGPSSPKNKTIPQTASSLGMDNGTISKSITQNDMTM